MGRIDKAFDLALANLPDGKHLVVTAKRGGVAIAAITDNRGQRVWTSRPKGLTEVLLDAAGHLIHDTPGEYQDAQERPAEG